MTTPCVLPTGPSALAAGAELAFQLLNCAVTVATPGVGCAICAVTSQVDTLRQVITSLRSGIAPSTLSASVSVGLQAGGISRCVQTCAVAVGRVAAAVLTSGTSLVIGAALCGFNVIPAGLAVYERLASCEYDRRRRRSDPSLIASAGVYRYPMKLPCK